MHFRSAVTCLALLASAQPVAVGCVNSDPVDEMEVETPTATASSTTPTTEPTATASQDTTMCGGSFETYGGMQATTGCSNSAPVNCNIASFEPNTYAMGAATDHWQDDTWNDGESLSGGVYMYTDTETPALVRDLVEGALHVTGTVPTGKYAGWLLWFGPCQDASAFDGIQFTVSGDLPGGTLVAQIQTDENYPIESGKGSCDYMGVEADKWNVCKNNSFGVAGVTPTSGFSYYVPFTDFSGGAPATTVSANQLRGVQFQINCGPDADCPVDVRLHDLRFYRGHAPALAPPM